MFTGIVEKLGTLVDLQTSDRHRILTVATPWSDLSLGESIAVNGVCLTVAELHPQAQDTPPTSPLTVQFYVSEETLQKTNLGHLTSGKLLNLERALTLQTRLSGHWVQGHVDGMGHLKSIRHPSTPASGAAAEGGIEMDFLIPVEFYPYCVKKGSITLNGVSLTLNDCSEPKDGTFLVHTRIIPHTWQATQLHQMQMGDPVNIEVDVLSKTLEQLLLHSPRLRSSHSPSSSPTFDLN